MKKRRDENSLPAGGKRSGDAANIAPTRSAKKTAGSLRRDFSVYSLQFTVMSPACAGRYDLRLRRKVMI